MNKFEINTCRIWRYFALGGAIILFLDLCFVGVNVILRSFFNLPIFGSTEIVRYSSLVGAALAMALNQYNDGNIRVTLIMELVSAKVRDTISFIADIVLACGFIYITYYLIQYVISLKSTADLTMELSMPTWLFALILCAGFVMMTLGGIVKAIVRGHCLFKAADYEEHKEAMIKITSTN